MSFESDINRFITKQRRRRRQIIRVAGVRMHNSIVNGDPATGSPGQPVDTGNLRTSWQLTFPEEDVAISTTNVPYAPVIEDGVSRRSGRRLVFKSQVGGPHSVKLTRAGLKKIVAAVAGEV